MKTLIVGNGEIGSSLYKIIKPHYPVWVEDVKPELRKMEDPPSQFDIIHICIRYGDNFNEVVLKYALKYKPYMVNICTTVPPGTTEKFGNKFCHSTTRGLHPNLEEGLKTIPKHIGGLLSQMMADYFEKIGINCFTHPKARTTELLHILNNAHYGINLMFADEAAKLCREYGVDFYDYLKYTETNNDGYIALGHKTKVRPILTPPGGHIGGHCLNMSAGLIPKEKRTKMVDMLSEYGK